MRRFMAFVQGRGNIVVLILFVVVAAAFSLSTIHTGHSSKSHTIFKVLNPSSVNASPTTSTTSTTKAGPTSSGCQIPPSTVTDPAYAELTKQVSELIENYYLLCPSDTDASVLKRMEAIQPPLTSALLGQLDLNVYTTDEGDQQRIADKITQTGIVSSITVQTMAGNPDLRNVITQVTVTDYTDYGTSNQDVYGSPPLPIPVATIWQQNSDGTWTCTELCSQEGC